MREKALKVVARVQARAASVRSERGDLVGWLLIAVMTAALIAVVWGFLGGELELMIKRAIGQASDATPG